VSVELRTPTVDDAPAITAFLAERSRAVVGESEFGEEEIRHWFTMPALWFQLAERDGRVVGYLDVQTEGVGRCVVDARAVDHEAAEALVAAAEAHVGSGRIHGVIKADDDVMRSTYEERGYELIRHSFQMRIELEGDLSHPEWPAGLVVRNLRPGDEERVHAATQDAFADHWDFHPQTFEQWRAYTLDRHDFDRELWWLVEDDGELAAAAVNSWHFSGDREFGWVQLLGVRPPWRRRGLATALLRQSFLTFRERGAKRVGLGVDAENTTGAVGLYERVGMRPYRRNDLYEKFL
jgi:mycothiol synthase